MIYNSFVSPSWRSKGPPILQSFTRWSSNSLLCRTSYQVAMLSGLAFSMAMGSCHFPKILFLFTEVCLKNFYGVITPILPDFLKCVISKQWFCDQTELEDQRFSILASGLMYTTIASFAAVTTFGKQEGIGILFIVEVDNIDFEEQKL